MVRVAQPVRTHGGRGAYASAQLATARKTTSQARADSSVNSSIFWSPAQREGVGGTPWVKSPIHAQPRGGEGQNAWWRVHLVLSARSGVCI